VADRRPGSPRARLFLALDLPPGPRAALAAWRDELIAGRDDLRPLAEDTLHLTFAFLGYRPEKEIGAIATTAFDAVRDFEPPLLSAAALRPLPPRSPRLFALDLDDRDGRAVALQAAASDALAAARFYRPEKRPFWPHVTLARVKRGRRAEPLAGPAPPGEPFEARVVTLYRSLLRPQGALYQPLERVSLGAGTGGERDPPGLL
jgi:2'-5' RNA ligase